MVLCQILAQCCCCIIARGLEIIRIFYRWHIKFWFDLGVLRIHKILLLVILVVWTAPHRKVEFCLIGPTFPPDIYEGYSELSGRSAWCFNRACVPARCPLVYSSWYVAGSNVVSIEPAFPPDVHLQNTGLTTKIKEKFHIWIPPLKQAVC